MARLVISYPLTPRSFKVLFASLIIFWFSSSRSIATDLGKPPGNVYDPAEATYTDGSFSTNQSFCTQNTGRSIFFFRNTNLSSINPRLYTLTAVSFFFVYQSYLASSDFADLTVSVYPASGAIDFDAANPLADSVQADLNHLPSISVDGESKAFQVIFPFRQNSGINLANLIISNKYPQGAPGFTVVLKCSSQKNNIVLWERFSGGPGRYDYFDYTTNSIHSSGTDSKLALTLYSGHPTPPSYKPAILLREAGRSVGIWDSLVNELAYGKSDYVRRFDYDESQNISTLALKLQDEVTALSNLSFSDWGDGQVDLVGYGLGGLIAERYLRDHPNDHHVRRFVAVAVPFKGTPLLNWSNYTGTVVRLGSWLNKKFTNGSRDLLGAANGFNTSTTAVSQMADDNSYIKNKDVVALPADVSVYSVRGSLPATYTQALFHFTATRQEDLGDLFVPGASAQPTWIPAANQKIFSEATDLGFTANLTKDSHGARVGFSGPETNNLNFLHGKLLDVPAVRSAIKAYLDGNN